MVRRHPHVFGTNSAKDSAEVLRTWEQTKLLERREQESRIPHGNKKAESLLDGVPRNVPATLEGYQLTRKAARIGFDWENVSGIFEKVSEESEELRLAIAGKNSSQIEQELGDLLFAAVNLSRFLSLDPEIALKNANAKFAKRFREMERLAVANGVALAKTPRPQMEELWNAVKRSEEKSTRGRSKLRR
jgi:tetrapyrrole methylase family protein/MazG family protein